MACRPCLNSTPPTPSSTTTGDEEATPATAPPSGLVEAAIVGVGASAPREAVWVTPTPLRALLTPRKESSFQAPRPLPREIPRAQGHETSAITEAAVGEKAAAAAPALQTLSRAVASPARGRSRSRAEVRRRLRRKSAPTAAFTTKDSSNARSATAPVAEALRLHGDLLTEFRRREEERGGDGWEGACHYAEQRATELYEDLVRLVLDLLPLANLESTREDMAGGYDVRLLRGQGVETPLAAAKARSRQRRGVTLTEDEEEAAKVAAVSEALERARSFSASGRARDALCAAIAVLASRREMCWLEAYDLETPARGYFAHALVEPRSVFRITLAGAARRPASLLLTKLLPVQEAFSIMDSGGPLVYAPKGDDKEEPREYALQELRPRADEWERNDRQPVQELVADERIKRLFREKESVLVIDAYVALAPREVARQEGLSAVVHAELVTLLERAKAEGRAVVFQAGGGDPTALAEKVYMRPAFVALGLRCGYLRWRPQAGASWARELPWKDRAVVGVLLP
eukprot:TRINITY_DN19686_c0_g1_i1.p1 TRINITY_DN19686_c0_g1~~TRINITY_DN19686_c0_g1_i1.p1  ORF type:complete len:537 (+),score=113.87 TRINITY_DN19686_c0_g1_i1:58-1611(+)